MKRRLMEFFGDLIAFYAKLFSVVVLLFLSVPIAMLIGFLLGLFVRWIVWAFMGGWNG